jgi:uncharacterized protein (DUF58 family)
MLTPRGKGLVLGAIAGMGVALFTLNLLLIMIAVFAVTFVAIELLAFGRVARTISPRWFTVERLDVTRSLSAGGLGVVRLRIAHPAPIPFTVELFDSIPNVVDVVRGSARLTTWWPRNGEFVLTYAFRARARGTHLLGPTVVVVHDPLGLAFRVVELDSRAEITVAPATPRVTLSRTAFRLATRSIGSVSVPRRGYGTEFRALRPYQPHDDYRSIAWRRSTPDHLIVREFEQESRQDFLIAISLARDMDVGIDGETAVDRACEAGVLLTQYVPRGGDQLGVATVGAEPREFLAPGRGALQTLRITDILTGVAATEPRTDLAGLLRGLSARLRRPTHVFAFTHVDDRIVEISGSLGLFRRAGHRLYLFPPDIPGFYPPIEQPDRQAVLELLRSRERRRSLAQWRTAQRLGIPVAPYDRRGIGTRLFTLYQQIHIWGWGG